MLVSSLNQCILIHQGMELESCLTAVEDIEPSVDLKWEGLFDCRRVVGLGVDIDGEVVRLSVRAMLPLSKVKSDIQVVCRFLR